MVNWYVMDCYRQDCHWAAHLEAQAHVGGRLHAQRVAVAGLDVVDLPVRPRARVTMDQ